MIRNTTRKTIAASLVFMMLFVQGVCAQHLSVNDIIVNLSGESQDAVRISVFDEDSSLVWIDSVSPDSSGKYDVDIALEFFEDKDMTYQVYSNGTKKTDVEVLGTNTVVDLFKSADASSLEVLLEKYAARFDIDISLYNESSDKDLVKELFMETSLTNAGDVKNMYMRAIAIDLLNGADRASACDIIEDYALYLDIDYDEQVKTLSSSLYEHLILDIISRNYDTFEEFSAAFSAALNYDESEDDVEVNSSPNYSSGGDRGGFGGSSVQTVTQQPVASDTPETTNPFSDTAVVSWAEESIAKLYDMGIINGKGDGIFAPLDNVTREEFVAMIVRAFGYESAEEADFADVDDSQWYAQYIKSASANGIINGISDEIFGVGTPISREDCAVIALRILKNKGKYEAKDYTENYTDSNEISEYAKEAVYYMQSIGILNGTGNNKFEPKTACNRAMAAKIIDMLGEYVK